MLCAFVSPTIAVRYFMHAHDTFSLSPSTLVGRFDGRGSRSAHSLFPFPTFSPNHECCIYNISVSAPPCHVLFLFLICHYPPAIATTLQQIAQHHQRSPVCQQF